MAAHRSSFMPRPVHLAVLAVCLLLSTGCETLVGCLFPIGPPLKIKGYSIEARSTPTEGELRAGVASIDITPPPGYPTGGHGPAGQVALGYWTRLKARAFFFETNENLVVLVTADLYAIAGGLHDLVAKRMAELGRQESECRGIPPDSLIIAATHTHQGPANYMTAKNYSQFGGSYPGFDIQLFEFLTNRLARVVCDAAKDAKPSTLDSRRFELPAPSEAGGNWGPVPGSGVPPGFLNRSPRSFLLNAHADAIMSSHGGPRRPYCFPGPGEPDTDWWLPGCPRLRAVNRSVHLLRILRNGQPHGTLVFFAVHPTVLVPDAPINSSDFVGWAMTALELDAISGAGQVAGFFNGAQGDVTARRTTRGVRDVAKFGREIYRQVKAELTRAQPMANPVVALAYGDVVSAGAKCGDLRLADKPMFGAAGLGGGEGDRTILHELGWRRGVRDRPREGHGVKLGALDSQLVRRLEFTTAFAPPRSFPESLPLTRGRIGTFEFVAVPAELTTSVGYSIRRNLSDSPYFPVVIGLADEYISYVSSSDEYPAQDYMAASTIWGQQEAGFIQCALSALNPGPRRPQKTWGKKIHWPGPKPKDTFGPAFVTGSAARAYLDDGLDELLLDWRVSPDRFLAQFCWEETGRDATSDHVCQVTRSGTTDRDADFCAAVRRQVEIQERDDGQWKTRQTPDRWDDTDCAMNIVTQAWKESDRVYGAIWLAPITERPAPIGEYRFKVSLWPWNGGPVCQQIPIGNPADVIYSQPFTLPARSRPVLIPNTCSP